MRWLEVRRHSLTKKGAARGRGSHLSAEGVALARLVGVSLGPFAWVVTSTSPLSFQDERFVSVRFLRAPPRPR
jgi:hypothetical protein